MVHCLPTVCDAMDLGKDFKVAEKNTSAYRLYLFLPKTGCFRQLAGAWHQEPHNQKGCWPFLCHEQEQNVPDIQRRLFITLDTSQEHSSHKDRRKWTVGLTGYLGRAAGEALMPSPSFFSLCWYHSLCPQMSFSREGVWL